MHNIANINNSNKIKSNFVDVFLTKMTTHFMQKPSLICTHN